MNSGMQQHKNLNIAIVAGGYSGECVVSLKSQEGIRSFLADTPYNLYSVVILQDRWYVALSDGTEKKIRKEDFSFTDEDGKQIHFDYAYITIHGTPGEDGLLIGYLDILGIPYSCSSPLVSGLTFNKYVCNNYLRGFGISVAKSIQIQRNEVYEEEQIIAALGLPLFVKPNNGGSSLATTRINSKEQLRKAINDALEVDKRALIEQFLDGTEVTCGCYEDASGIHTLPITEVVTENEFFDFDAKYNGQVKEITPARIAPEIELSIKDVTKQVYRILQASGIIRIDYIIRKDGTPFLLEVNTTPGMTTTSFIPQQIRAARLDITQVFCDIINFHLSHKMASL